MAILASMHHDPSILEDTYQSAFVKFLQLFRAGPKPGIEYEAYFVAVLKNCLLDELRRGRRTIPIDEVFETALPHVDESETLEVRVSILLAIMHLDQRCRYAIEGFYMRQLDVKRLAEDLKVDPGSIYMTLKRCRDQLKKVLGDR